MCIRDSNHTDNYIKWRFRYIACMGIILFAMIVVFIRQKSIYSLKYYDSIATLHDIYESTKHCSTEDFVREFKWYEEVEMPLNRLRNQVLANQDQAGSSLFNKQDFNFQVSLFERMNESADVLLTMLTSVCNLLLLFNIFINIPLTKILEISLEQKIFLNIEDGVGSSHDFTVNLNEVELQDQNRHQLNIVV
eukprot:TRINITY_DN4993_c0_g1_i5.p1 TRINITY_DN4993_c0_g1~~TRINITY_DN4993_c0_g1_i5.p1  ORF type:complete len:192 (+),score=6.95 TRINITY_DN4993_c0_g1_i5:66-641(+)